MTLAKHFTIRPERVVHETIEGETIIIHLESGTYYSLTGPGAEIWAMLAAGVSTEQIVQELEQRYAASPEELARATQDMVRELRREELLEDDPSPRADGKSSDAAAIAEANGHLPFTAPILQKYTDMQYFLQLDPIHEVDEVGWPNLPSDQTVS